MLVTDQLLPVDYPPPAAVISVSLDGTITHGQKAFAGTSTTITVSHTTGTLTNGLMIIAITVGVQNETNVVPVVSSITWNGVSTGITLINSATTSVDGKVFLYYLLAPASGTHDVVATVSRGATGNGDHLSITMGVATFEGVDQTTPITGSGVTNTGTSGTSTSLTVSSNANNYVFAVHGEGSSAGFTSTNQTQAYIENIDGNSSCGNGAANSAVGDTSVSMTASWAVSDHWQVIGADINHA